MRLYSTLAALILTFVVGCTPLTTPPDIKMSPPIRVLLAELGTPGEFQLTGPYYLYAEEARYEFGQRNTNFSVRPFKNGIQISNQNRNFVFKNSFPVALKPSDAASHFVYNGEEYAGEIHLNMRTDSTVMVINVLPLDEYLKGVVPAEMPSLQSDYYQAVKAQAICARTYAIKRIAASTKNGFDVQGSIADQAYAGFSRHTTYADQAVDETRGMILMFNGQPATVYYHSTCGGRLEAASEVWPDAKAPYLTTSTDAVGDLFSCIASPYFRWAETKSLTELDSTFYIHFNKSLLNTPVTDTIQAQWDMRVTRRSASGRAQMIEIDYADTTVALQGYEIRRFFAAPGKTYLPSTLLFFSQANDSTLTIEGGGNGHGVGMCQYGALNMSKRGFQYYHILSKYYQNTVLSRYY